MIYLELFYPLNYESICTAYLHRLAVPSYEFNSILVKQTLHSLTKDFDCFDCIFLIPEIHNTCILYSIVLIYTNTITSINYRTTSSIEIAKEISCIVCGFFQEPLKNLAMIAKSASVLYFSASLAGTLAQKHVLHTLLLMYLRLNFNSSSL